jgi:hypothetical protein
VSDGNIPGLIADNPFHHVNPTPSNAACALKTDGSPPLTDKAEPKMSSGLKAPPREASIFPSTVQKIEFVDVLGHWNDPVAPPPLTFHPLLLFPVAILASIEAEICGVIDGGVSGP